MIDLLINYNTIIWMVIGSILIISLLFIDRFFYISSTFILFLVIISMIRDYNANYIPIDDYPPKNVLYMHHSIQLAPTGRVIYLWGINEQEKNVLYKFPYDENTARELEKVKYNNDNGIIMSVEKIEGSDSDSKIKGEPFTSQSPSKE